MRTMSLILCAGTFSCERRGIIVFCIVHTFASTVLLAQAPLCRTLAVGFLVLRYTNNHHHPYIDSTTVLFDMYIYILYIYIYIYTVYIAITNGS